MVITPNAIIMGATYNVKPMYRLDLRSGSVIVASGAARQTGSSAF